MSIYQQLLDYQREVSLLSDISATLYWDQTTIMPPDAGAYRGEQSSYLAGLMFEKSTSQQYQDLIESAWSTLQDEPEHSKEKLNVFHWRKQLKRRLSLTTEFVKKWLQQE